MDFQLPNSLIPTPACEVGRGKEGKHSLELCPSRLLCPENMIVRKGLDWKSGKDLISSPAQPLPWTHIPEDDSHCLFSGP